MYYLWKCLFMPAAFLLAFILTDCSGEKESGKPGVLVSTGWLQDHLNDPNVVILHSGSAELFDSHHIPGARLIIPGNFTINNAQRSNEIPHTDSIVNLLQSAGVNKDSRIVLYYEDSRMLRYTSRVYLTLDYLGLGDRTFILNGGLPVWQEEEREITDVNPDFSRGNIESLETKELVITADELDLLRWDPDFVVIDARSDEEYYGTPETEEYYSDGGHIEGAYFLSYLDIVTDDNPNFFKSDSELEEMFQKAGMDPEKMTVFYCNSGIKATVCYVAAIHLGYPALLYDGSFNEWEELDMPYTGPVTLPEKNE